MAKIDNVLLDLGAFFLATFLKQGAKWISKRP